LHLEDREHVSSQKRTLFAIANGLNRGPPHSAKSRDNTRMMKFRRFCLAALALSAFAHAADTPATALLILNKSESKLAILDPRTNQVVAKVPTGDQPHEVAVSADGRLAYVSNYSGRTISAIDLAGQKERRVDLGELARPHGIWFHDGKVYFTAEGSRMLGRYDPASNKVDWTFTTGQNTTHMVSVSRDGNRIFATNIGSDSVSILERRGADWKQTVIAVGRGPEGFSVSPDGRELWAAHSGDGGISVIDIASKKVTQTIPRVTQRSNRLQFSPDGRLALVSDASNGDLAVLDVAARKESKRLRLGSGAEGILITPDGARAYVALERANAVVIVDMKKLETMGHIDMGPGSGPDGMAWAVRK
jgi:YVTN family beta-propeller protein